MKYFTDRELAAHGRLRLFSMYLDFPASIRARWAHSTMSQIAGEQWIISTELWKIDSLDTNAAISRMVTEEAARADIITIVASSLNYRHHPAIQWLEKLGAGASPLAHKGLLIGLFGDDYNHKSELSWTVNQLLNCAAPMNRDFIWHWMGSGAMSDYSWLTDNLQPFLNRKRHEMEDDLLAETQLAAV